MPVVIEKWQSLKHQYNLHYLKGGLKVDFSPLCVGFFKWVKNYTEKLKG